MPLASDSMKHSQEEEQETSQQLSKRASGDLQTRTQNITKLKVQNSKYAYDGLSHVAEYRDLEYQVGPILGDIQSILFGLSGQELEKFLSNYEKLYGFKARDYATETIPLWNTGARKMSGQTASRLLNLIPYHLSTKQRYELVKKLCLHHVKKNDFTIYINKKDTSSAYQEINDAIAQLTEPVTLKYLPEEIQKVILWIYESDITVSRGILAELDKQINEQVNNQINKDMSTIRSIVNSESIDNYSESFEFATGSIKLVMPSEKWCFIANVVYDESEVDKILTLREFRDSFILSFQLGKKFTRLYYLRGRRLAWYINNSTILSTLTKAGLNVVVIFLRKVCRYE
jgi:hypothetical protein